MIPQGYNGAMKMKKVIPLLVVLLVGTLLSSACARRAIPGMVIQRDIPYTAIDGVDPNLLSLDIYAPPDASGLPVLLMVHGGGWSGGDKANRDMGLDKASYFTGNGFVYVSINYRLSPDVQHPAHIEDVAAALSWTLEHIHEYGGDPARLSLMGHSAGAHLVALVASDPRWLSIHGHSLAEIEGVILLDGAGYDIPDTIDRLYPPGRVTRMYTQAFSEDPATWVDASPVSHVSAGKGIPPFLILHTGREAAVSESEELARLLEGAGVATWRLRFDRKTHASINREIGDPGDPVSDVILAFLQQQPPYDTR